MVTARDISINHAVFYSVSPSVRNKPVINTPSRILFARFKHIRPLRISTFFFGIEVAKRVSKPRR